MHFALAREGKTCWTSYKNLREQKLSVLEPEYE